MIDGTLTARDLAVLALRDPGQNVSARLEHLLERNAMGGEDRALARELALGVVRRRGTLRMVLRSLLDQPNRKLPGVLPEVLYVAMYQILFLDRVPDFAAVNEAVEQTRRFRHNRQSGLVNGLLRGLTRRLSPVRTGVAPVAADTLPLGPGAYRTFDRAVFADPLEKPSLHFADVYSVPEPLARRWIAQFGPEQAARIGVQINLRAPLICRVNRLRATVEQAIARLADEGVAARAHANGISVVLDSHAHVAALRTFSAGVLQPQDASATAVGLAAQPRPGMAVLDFCAAPGTKTTHLAELMDNQGSILAVDVSDEKLQRVRENCDRLGLGIVTTQLAQAVGSLEVQSFDLVLADVPCSNSGVLARRPEARWRFDPAGLGPIVNDQKFLVMAAGAFVKPGGRLVYSTCSIEPEECQQVARHVTAASRGRLEMIAERLTLPAGGEDLAQWTDGGYHAVFRMK